MLSNNLGEHCSKEFCFHCCKGQKLSCVSAHFDKYVGCSIFNSIMKSSSKKRYVDKYSNIWQLVACMLLVFEVKAVVLPEIH